MTTRPLREIIADLLEKRREMAKHSMETGISRRGDLTQLDEQIQHLSEIEYQQQHGGRSR